jgi:hypothetical protein
MFVIHVAYHASYVLLAFVDTYIVALLELVVGKELFKERVLLLDIGSLRLV